MLLPTIPAPMTTTLAHSGSAAMSVLLLAPVGRRRPSGQVDDDRLQLGQPLDGEATADPPEPALRARATAEREMRLPVVGALVDVHPAGANALREVKAAAQVLGEDGG